MFLAIMNFGNKVLFLFLGQLLLLAVLDLEQLGDVGVLLVGQVDGADGALVHAGERLLVRLVHVLLLQQLVHVLRLRLLGLLVLVLVDRVGHLVQLPLVGLVVDQLGVIS